MLFLCSIQIHCAGPAVCGALGSLALPNFGLNFVSFVSVVPTQLSFDCSHLRGPSPAALHRSMLDAWVSGILGGPLAASLQATCGLTGCQLLLSHWPSIFPVATCTVRCCFSFSQVLKLREAPAASLIFLPHGWTTLRVHARSCG